MNTTTEERITEENWNITAAGKEIRELCASLAYSADQRASLQEMARLSLEVYNKVGQLFINSQVKEV